jgi:hypothetical protein
MGFGIVLAILTVGICIDQLRKSLAQDSSKVQALLAEIRDIMGKNEGIDGDATEQ